MTALDAARAAGLVVRAKGDQLDIRGSVKSSQDLLPQLTAQKAEVLRQLRRERFTVDPRPDLTHDTALWSRFLVLAYDRDGEDPNGGLFGVLHGLRCCGAALKIEAGHARLTRGEMSADEYRHDRERYLMPHAPALRQLLQDLIADAT